MAVYTDLGQDWSSHLAGEEWGSLVPWQSGVAIGSGFPETILLCLLLEKIIPSFTSNQAIIVSSNRATNGLSILPSSCGWPWSDSVGHKTKIKTKRYDSGRRVYWEEGRFVVVEEDER